MSDIRVISAGLYSTFQDAGRFEYRHLGIPVSGAMDRVSFLHANDLVQNESSEAVLEITLLGPKLEFKSDQLFAITGADLSAKIDDRPVELNRPLQIRAGNVLSFGRPMLGCRSYLSVAGGFDLDKHLGSYSSYEAAKLGRPALKKEDLIGVKKSIRDLNTLRSVDQNNNYDRNVIRVLKAPESDILSPKELNHLTKSTFTISNDSNRMAYNLEADPSCPWKGPSIVSSAVLPGTIQLPPNGNPIILMRDCQTTGGYPRVAQVITEDIDLLAQKKPGDQINISFI